jgi:hypothetical protein
MSFKVRFFANGKWFSTATANYVTDMDIIRDGIYGEIYGKRGSIEQAVRRHVNWFEAELSFAIEPRPVEPFSVPIPPDKRKFYGGRERLAMR